MSRHHADWLEAYLEYTDITEAPAHVRFWCGVSAIAGALRRKVWIDQDIYKWYPNFYIILVAKPAIIAKSTTAGTAMSLLREVPGIRFGPDVVTWPQLVSKFAASLETFEYPPGVHNPMSALTLESSEFGNLLNPQDREMVDMYISLWDGKQGAFTKETKTSGCDEVINPWINLIACTTPSWIAGTFPEHMINGGFISRCVLVYAEEKAKEVAYPRRQPRRRDRERLRQTLIEDLIDIGSLKGEYKLTEEAYEWGEAWYTRHLQAVRAESDERVGNYLARKQTHMHKLAMVLAAATGASMWLEKEHLITASTMVSDLEPDMAKVFAKVGRSEESAHTQKLLDFIRKAERVEWETAFRYVHKEFPGIRDFENIVNGLIRSKLVLFVQQEGKFYLMPGVPD